MHSSTMTAPPSPGMNARQTRHSALTKDDFSSQGGSYIKLGWHKSNNSSPEKRQFNETFLNHTASRVGHGVAAALNDSIRSSNSSSSNAGATTAASSNHHRNHSSVSFGDAPSSSGGSQAQLMHSADGSFNPNRGLHATKFHIGFNRKNQSQILNAAADENREKMNEKNILKERMNYSRSDFLRQNDERSGFNVISHASRGDGPPAIKQGKKKIEMVVSAEIAANSRIQLRESVARFHMPHASGPGHEYRQSVLTTDGIPGQRYSAVLQEGKADLPSFGIEDNFGKSRYPGGPALPPDQRVGLYEMREAGKFTPRKQPNNPSGNEVIVKNWGSGIDIANACLKGRLK